MGPDRGEVALGCWEDIGTSFDRIARARRSSRNAGALTAALSGNSWRAVVLAAGSLLLVAALGLELTTPRLFGNGAGAQPRALAPHAAGTKLPLTAQGPVSRVLGRDDPSYRAAGTGAGLVLRNPSHKLGARFERRGVVIRSGRATLGLRLSAYGYGRALRAVGAVGPRAHANRVLYRRPALDEWYANGPLGLEQGFTLAARPASGHGGRLTLALALSGNLRAALSHGGVTFTGPGTSLAYRGLIATDARGRQLPARIELRRRALLLRVDDRGARYPLRIDPFVQQAKLTASDGSTDFFGFSVAVSGDTVVVGAPYATFKNFHAGPGAAYVFVKPASGWVDAHEQAKLTASDGAASDEFGFSVAVSGNTVVVGARSATTRNFQPGPGAAYVFTKPAGGWASETEQAKLTASDGPQPLVSSLRGEFGYSVGISGDTVVVGAPGALINGHLAQGAVYLFLKPVVGWASGTEQAKLTASDGAFGDALGTSVAVSGDTVVAGAPCPPFRRAPVGGCKGAAYVFVKHGGGWTSETEQAKLTASDGPPSVSPFEPEFGYSVALSGDTVVVGAPRSAVNGQVDRGAAYVFTKPASGWTSETEQAKLTASDSAGQLGYSVAVFGDTVVAGAPEQGAAYVFTKPASGWTSETEQAKLTASDSAGGDNFGVSVAVSGGTVVAGAIYASTPPGVFQGAAYVFGLKNATTTSVSCKPQPAVAGNSTTCTATVTDTATSGQTTPTGTVSFTSSGPGAFGSGGSCTLTAASSSSASCSVTYTPGSTPSNPVRTDTITASYNGDTTHAKSSNTTDVEVISPTALASGSFVIGDQNAGVGTAVTFWGAHWSTLNSLSGGPAPPSFKGFASHTPNNPPKCGDHWTTEQGASSNPPATVPQYMEVIAAGSITKSGPTISGDAPEVVVVKTDPGYRPDPGSAGTGTVVAEVCHS